MDPRFRGDDFFMYKDFFRLTDYPFNITANPKFIYWTRSHEEALSFLIYGVEMRKGFVLLTGDVGTGKTTICRAFIETLGDTHRTAFIFNPNLSELELLASIVEDFGLEPARRTKKGYFDALNQFLLKQNRHDRTAVLIIDESQCLSRKALEQIRLLSNLETADTKLLQIVLVGQPELRKTLDNPNLIQLKQRISVRYHLKPIAKEEVGLYVEHRLKMAGADGELRFESSTFDIIYEYSSGVPRLINMLCDKALLAAFSKDKWIVTDALVIEAQSEIQEVTIEGSAPREHYF